MKIKLGIFGIRGVVGKTLLGRIKKNFLNLFKIKKIKSKDYFDNKKLSKIKKCKIIISCKDKLFSKKMYFYLKNNKWKGYWIDASSYFRRSKKSVISLDLINKKTIIKKINNNYKIFCGGNCTVSIMLIAIGGIINNLKEIFCTTFQSISGAGYLDTANLFKNCFLISKKILKSNGDIFESANKVFNKINNNLVYSLVPWIGKDEKKNSEEENKAVYEIKKIIGKKIKIHSTCVRVNSFRCHSESIIIKTIKDITLNEFKYKISNFSKYVRIVNNKKNDTIKKLNPNYVSFKEKIYIGRIRKIKSKTFSIFVIGDQLIWGAVEPLLRLAKIIYNEKFKKL
ncbi:aspartate-semialdehyde dehydrogenase [Candidatus Vidania fulgoroideorum]